MSEWLYENKERPIGDSGVNGAEAREMRDAARASGSLNMLNFEFRQQPARIKARELIASGAIGAPVHFTMTSYGSGLRGHPHGWLFDASQGGGWIGAYGSHIIDGIRALLGTDVVDCGGLIRTEVKQRKGADGALLPATAEDAFSTWFTLANGATAMVDTGVAASVTLPAVVQVMGTEGALTIAAESVVTLIRPNAEPEVFDLTPTKDNPFPSLSTWLTLVTEAVREGRQIAPSFDDGVATAEAMEKLRAAVHHG